MRLLVGEEAWVVAAAERRECSDLGVKEAARCREGRARADERGAGMLWGCARAQAGLPQLECQGGERGSYRDGAQQEGAKGGCCAWIRKATRGLGLGCSAREKGRSGVWWRTQVMDGWGCGC